MATVKFKRLTEVDFNARYPEAAENIEEEVDLGSMQYPDEPYGEVNVPGHGWHACLIGRAHGEPIQFFNEDDGWLGCPRNMDFEEVTE